MVAWIHTHPYQPGIQGGYPSENGNAASSMSDWEARDLLEDLSDKFPGIDVDPNLLMYILDMQGEDMYEYDKNDRDKDSLGESVSC